MKLRNKLIPLATVFATGAVIAPCALTSCSAATGMADLTSGNYATTIHKAKTEGNVADEDLAMRLWMSSIESNPEVFIQDRYWGDAGLIKGFADHASINVTSAKGQCKNVSVKYVTIKDGELDRKIPTVSMTYTLTVESNWSVTGVASDPLKGLSELDVADYAQYAAAFGSPLYFPILKYFYDEGVPGKIYQSCVYESTWENIPVAFFDLIANIKTAFHDMVVPGIIADLLDDGYELEDAIDEAEYDFENFIWPYVPEMLPQIITKVTAWTIQPSLTFIQMMDDAKLDWKYSVKYAKEDTFVFDKNGVETSKVNGSSLDRTYNNYRELISGPSVEEAKFYTNAGGLLASEFITSFYLSDLTKTDTK